jgi:hypothetical protein
MWEVRLAVRYRSGLRSGDPTRWWMDRSWMDLGDHLLTDHLSHWSMDHRESLVDGDESLPDPLVDPLPEPLCE